MFSIRQEAQAHLNTMRDPQCYRVCYSKSAEILSNGKTPYVIWHW